MDMEAQPQAFEVTAIGFVDSELRDRSLAARQPDEGAPPARLKIFPEYQPAMHGLESGDSIVVVTWLHQADREVLQCHPRGDLDRPVEGVFATRSSDRPNPIGLHEVRVTGLDGSVVSVDRLEAIDGTPVLDIKPVLGSAPTR